MCVRKKLEIKSRTIKFIQCYINIKSSDDIIIILFMSTPKKKKKRVNIKNGIAELL